MPDKFEFLFEIRADKSHELFEPAIVALLVELHRTDPARFIKLWNHFKSARITTNLTVLTNEMNAYRRDNPQLDADGFLLRIDGSCYRQNVPANFARALEIALDGAELPDDLDSETIADLHMKASDALGFIPDRELFGAVLRDWKRGE